MKGYGEKLRSLRKAKKLSQEEAAAQAGVSFSSYSKYEKEIRRPNDDAKIRLADLFGSSVQEIFF